MTSRFLILFWWHVVRNVRRHRLLALLNVLTIALGIAVCLAIQVANGSANRSFAAGVDLVAGKAHLEVRGDVDETLWPEIAKAPGVAAATAVVQGVVTLPDFPGEYLQLVGLDLFTNEPFRTFELQKEGQRLDFNEWLATPGGIALSGEFARLHGLKVGAHLRVLVNSEVREVKVLGIIDPGESPVAVQSRLAVMDLGWAQELFGRVGHLSSVQVLLANPKQSVAVVEALRGWLPADLEVQAPRQRSLQIEEMLGAFQLNLTALSMVSLLVGTFLIYTTVSASVARRRHEIGILRAMGATRLEVRCLFLGEAFLFAVCGLALGEVAGLALANLLVGAVAQTISSLYLLVSIERAEFAFSELWLSASLGLVAVLAGAWIPASEAARIDPLVALHRNAVAQLQGIRSRRLPWLGLGLLLLALPVAWIALTYGPAGLAFGTAFFVLAAFALFAPLAILWFNRLFSRVKTLVVRMAAENLLSALHRNGIIVGALSVAVAMMVGLTIMIFSFRNSVEAWVNYGIVADLYVAPASNETIGLSATVPEPAITWLRSRPEVLGVDTFSEMSVMVGSRRAVLAVIDGAYRGNMMFSGGNAQQKMERVFAGEGVTVTESFARKFAVQEGDQIPLTTPGGVRPFKVLGIYADYTRDQGVILMGSATCRQFWGPRATQSLAVYLHPGATSPAEAFQAEFGRLGQFSVYSNRALRQRIFAIFDQTFTVTDVLRWISILVALVGIFLTVTTLVSERIREIGVLRAIGASRLQITVLFMAESAMIGALAALLGLASGGLLALVLTRVVNPAFFGWSIPLQLPWQNLLLTPFWIIAAALVAAWYPSWRGSQTPMAEAIRDE